MDAEDIIDLHTLESFSVSRKCTPLQQSLLAHSSPPKTPECWTLQFQTEAIFPDNFYI